MLSDEHQFANQCPECGGMMAMIASYSDPPAIWICFDCGNTKEPTDIEMLEAVG